MVHRACRLDLRVTREEREEAIRLAKSLNLTVSELVRIPLRLPAGFVVGAETKPVFVIDTTSAFMLARESRWWGYQYNQIAHALNRIALYLRRGMADADDALEQLLIVEDKVNKANSDISVLRAEAVRMAAMFNVWK